MSLPVSRSHLVMQYLYVVEESVSQESESETMTVSSLFSHVQLQNLQ